MVFCAVAVFTILFTAKLHRWWRCPSAHLREGERIQDFCTVAEILTLHTVMYYSNSVQKLIDGVRCQFQIVVSHYQILTQFRAIDQPATIRVHLLT